MKRGLLLLFFWLLSAAASALEIKHDIDISIGVFNACHATFTYAVDKAQKYRAESTLNTIGAFDTLYPLKAKYNAHGTYLRNIFKPELYHSQTKTRFNSRSKDVFYENGIPLYRVSIKNDYKRQDAIVPDAKYPSSNDLLTTAAEIAWHLNQTGNCDFEQYSFNGKRYSLSKLTTVGYENLTTPHFSGRALKCRYELEVLDDAEAGFLLDKDEPIYFWLLQDTATHAYFFARALVENTPFGQLEALTTKIEVKP